MSHDDDLAQKRLLEAKRTRYEAEWLRETFERTRKQMEDIQQSIQRLQGVIATPYHIGEEGRC